MLRPKVCVLLKANGAEEEVYPDGEDGRWTLEGLQSLVDGMIECVAGGALRGKDRLVVNEEGRLRGLAVNRRASMVAGQTIVGDAVIVSLDQLE